MKSIKDPACRVFVEGRSRPPRGFAVLWFGALAVLLGLIAPLATFAAPGPVLEPSLRACTVSGTGIRVTVEKVKSSKGLITAVLYNNEPKNFLKKGRRLDRTRVAAVEGATSLCLTAPGPGVYAVALYHDENGNTKFDRGALGIPLEGYGFSNDPRFTLGPPEHEDVIFEAGPGTKAIKISLRYL
jgi:uncharacterized protein (DUF2141 family)